MIWNCPDKSWWLNRLEGEMTSTGARSEMGSTEKLGSRALGRRERKQLRQGNFRNYREGLWSAAKLPA